MADQNGKESGKLVVISVGGSLIVPDQIDTEFLKSFKSLVDEEVKIGKRFIIVCGGGKTARIYQHAATAVTTLRPEDVDWLGIHSTRLNAQLVKSIFVNVAEEYIVHDPFEENVLFEKPILIAAGWKPGWSTDYVAVCMAKQYGAKCLTNLSNIDYVYDKDPRTHSDAKKIEKISWSDFRNLIPKEWDPGLSSPFDPVASKEAESIGLEVAIINGKKLDELRKCIKGEDFLGTLIK